MFNPSPIFVKRGHEAARAIAALSHPGFFAARRECRWSVDNALSQVLFGSRKDNASKQAGPEPRL
jgi:hypothetical protein